MPQLKFPHGTTKMPYATTKTRRSQIKILKKVNCEASIDRGMDKQNVVYTHNEILFNLKKEGNYASCNMDETSGHKPVTNKYCMIPLLSGP